MDTFGDPLSVNINGLTENNKENMISSRVMWKVYGYEKNRALRRKKKL